MKKSWTSAELISAIETYKAILNNGESITAANGRLQALAKEIGRTIGSVVMRMHNFEYFRTDGRKGLSNAGKTALDFWNSYYVNA